MSERPACVLLSPVFPNPRGSGLEQRVFFLLHDLSATYEVTLVTCSSPGCEAAQVTRLLAGHISVPTKRANPVARRLAMLFPGLLRRFPEWASDWPVPVEPADRASLPADPQLVVCFRMRMHGVRGFLLPGTRPSLLDMDDLESAARRSIAGCALRRGYLRTAVTAFLSSRQYKVLESTVGSQYDAVTLANPADVRKLASRIGVERVAHRCNKICVPESVTRAAANETFLLGFIGTLEYFPNFDAALWIVEEVVPRLGVHLHGAFQVCIAGRGASKYLRNRLARLPEIRFLGEVADIGSFYRTLNVALSVVRCGGGTKLKFLEAIAFGCPAVATPHSAEGLPFVPGEDFLAGTTADEIARLCAKLQARPKDARSMAERAYARISASSCNADAVLCNSTRQPCSSE